MLVPMDKKCSAMDAHKREVECVAAATRAWRSSPQADSYIKNMSLHVILHEIPCISKSGVV